MRKLLVLFMLFVTLILTGCVKEESIPFNEENGYKLYMDDNYTCDQVITVIGTDDNFQYSFDCDKAHAYTIETPEGIEYTFNEFLLENVLNFSDMFTLFNGELLRSQITIDPTTILNDTFPTMNFENLVLVDSINGYDIYETDNSYEACDTPISFTFGDYTFEAPSGCDTNFVSLGYVGFQGSVIYPIEQLIQINVLSAEYIYNNIYPNRFVDTIELNVFPQIETFGSLYTQSESTYAVYVYSPESSSSKNLKNEIFEFLSETDMKIYLLALEDDSYSAFIPNMVVIDNGLNVKNYHDITQIRDFIESVENGSFSNLDFDSNIETIKDNYGLKSDSFPIYYGTVSGYKLYSNIVYSTQCETGVAFSYQGYQYVSYTACTPDFIGLGYMAIKSGSIYEIRDLVESGTISIEETSTLFGIENTGLEYNDISLIHIYSTTQVLSQAENEYYVYFYSPSCSHCQSIKNTMLNFVLNDTSKSIYFVNQNYVDSENLSSFIDGFPTIIKVVAGVVVHDYVGTVEIGDLINSN